MKDVYETPTIVLTVLQAEDIVRTSPGDEYTGDDFPAFTN